LGGVDTGWTCRMAALVAALAAAACGSAPGPAEEETMSASGCPVPRAGAGTDRSPAAVPVAAAPGLRTATFALG
jgi:hypothetical protein